MDLKLIKTRYGGNCVRCNRELKKDWGVYFSSDSKALYCKPCGELLVNGGEKQPSLMDDSEVPENINIIAKLDELILQISHFNTHFQLVHADNKNIIEKLNKLNETTTKKETKSSKK